MAAVGDTGNSERRKGAHRPRVLFIARAYPPTVGGMESFAYQLGSHLACRVALTPLINGRGKKALPAFLPYAAIAAIRIVRRERIEVVHLADALLAPLGAVVKRATGVPVTVSVHGLDVTYANPAYQFLVPRALRCLDGAMANSAATASVFRERTQRPCVQVIPLGVNAQPAPSSGAVKELAQMLRLTPEQPMLLTVGRLVERKGAAWFIRHVLPRLPGDAVYAIAGEGPQREAIAAAASDAGVTNRVRVLGRVSDDLLAAAYARTDVFVMPNIPVADDMEGFGLVALEAAASGLPVVASELEGITEALRNGSNGVLVPPGDAQAYARELSELLGMSRPERLAVGERAAAYTRERYGWDRTADEYIRAMQLVVRRSNNDVAGAPIES